MNHVIVRLPGTMFASKNRQHMTDGLMRSVM